MFPKCKLWKHGKAVSVTLYIISFLHFLTKIDTWRTFFLMLLMRDRNTCGTLGELEKTMEAIALWVFLKLSRKVYEKCFLFLKWRRQC